MLDSGSRARSSQRAGVAVEASLFVGSSPIRALAEDWDFEFAWGARAAVADTARGLAGRRLDAKGTMDVPGHLPIPLEVAPRTEPPDGTRLLPVAPDGLEGEFDDRIDPRFPLFSAVPLAETLPGPLTPMTLDVQLAGLRAANRVMSQVMALDDVTAGEWGSRAIAVFSHRPYVGVSASVIAAGQLPGWDAREVVQQSLGGDPVGELLLRDMRPTPEEAAAEDDEQALLHALIDQLPSELRQPLLLSAIDELTSREIGLAMDIPEGTVRTRLMRARNELRRNFEALTTSRPGETAVAGR